MCIRDRFIRETPVIQFETIPDSGWISCQLIEIDVFIWVITDHKPDRFRQTHRENEKGDQSSRDPMTRISHQPSIQGRKTVYRYQHQGGIDKKHLPPAIIEY